MNFKINLFSDEKFRSLFYQVLVVGLFALGIYFLVNTTAYNLEKRNIGPDTPLAIARGLNALWTDGGILYAPPFR